MKLLFVFAIAGALLGAAILLGGLLLSNGAPQEAAVAGIAVACAIIPYCVARAVHGISSIESLAAIREEQETQTRILAAIGNKITGQRSTPHL